MASSNKKNLHFDEHLDKGYFIITMCVIRTFKRSFLSTTLGKKHDTTRILKTDVIQILKFNNKTGVL